MSAADAALMLNCCCCVAGYFTDCIYEQDLDEMNIEIIRNLLYKA